MESNDKIPTFKPVGHYEWPVRQTEESARRLLGQLWRTVRREKKPDPFITDESLRWSNRSRLNQIVAPPACGPLLREMEATFADWIADNEPTHWLQLVVLPPCDQDDLVRSWAMVNGHAIIDPPARDAILEPAAMFDLPETTGDGVIVVPRLEYWFLRHHSGLREVRALLQQLTRLERHCVVGCNSWAWGFLAKAAIADAVFPCGLMFQAFDAVRLRRWLGELASDGADSEKTFRSSMTGEDVFTTVDENATPNDFFHKLAARSLGIPWVAWHLWRRCIRLGPEKNADTKPIFSDEETLWVADLEEFEMPKQDVATALLVLHALLIHDSLTSQQIELVVPNLSCVNVLASLLAAGFILREAERYRCSPAAYPAIRARLNNAGFPMDQL